MGKYQDDIEARFPTHVVTVTTDNSVFNCEVKTAGDVVVANARALTEDEAVCAARAILGVKEFEPLKGSENDAEALEALYGLLDRQSQHDYGDKSGAFTIDMSNGNGLEQKFTLEGSLDTDDITITLPGGPRRVCVQVDQDGTGGWDIPADAWPGTLEWGSKGAPTFGDAAGSVRFIVFHHVDGTLYGHYDTNVF